MHIRVHVYTCRHPWRLCLPAEFLRQPPNGLLQTWLGLTLRNGLVRAACPALGGQQRPFSARYNFCELVSLLWLGAPILLVVRAFRHDRIKLALDQPAQECTAACNLPGNTPCLSLLPSVIVAAHVISVPWSSPVT